MNQLTKYLNLGCGDRYLDSWTNVDFRKTGPGVIVYNLLKGIPYPDESFDAVYHSHVLEHFSKGDAKRFISECFRVLRKGGIIRVVVPDLEMIAREYLRNMERGLSGEAGAEADYEWIKLEMYDQTVRNFSGGDMETYLRQPVLPNEEYVMSRIGEEGKILREMYLHPSTRKLKNRNLKEKLLQLFFAIPFLKRYFIGRFRLRGQIHQWMYDRYCLAKLLESAGFSEARVMTAFESQIPDWANSHSFLDVENGKVRKPDSMFMEALKPRLKEAV